MFKKRLKPSERNKRKLAFNEKGKYEDIANKLRTKAKLNLLQHEISAISKKTGIASESRLSLIQPKRFTVFVLIFVSKIELSHITENQVKY